MISKKVAMKTPEKSRFGKLVAYLLDPQGKKTRVGEVAITNCISTDTTWAVREIAATQRLNARAKSDLTYYLPFRSEPEKIRKFSLQTVMQETPEADGAGEKSEPLVQKQLRKEAVRRK